VKASPNRLLLTFCAAAAAAAAAAVCASQAKEAQLREELESLRAQFAASNLEKQVGRGLAMLPLGFGRGYGPVMGLGHAVIVGKLHAHSSAGQH
jgi:hypothetical protein